jgi:hypothetical protein
VGLQNTKYRLYCESEGTSDITVPDNNPTILITNKNVSYNRSPLSEDITTHTHTHTRVRNEEI